MKAAPDVSHPRAGAPDEDGEPVCDLAAAIGSSQHAHQCEYPLCILHKDLWPFLASVPELTALCPGWGVGDPEAVIPLGALLRDSSAL